MDILSQRVTWFAMTGQSFQMSFTPAQKGSASILLAVVSVVFAGTALFMLYAPLIRSAYWLYFIVGPFALFLLWISRTFVYSWWNSSVVTTEFVINGESLIIRNRPYGSFRDFRLSSIRSVVITDVLDRAVCFEMLLTDRMNRTHQLMAFRCTSDAVLDIYDRILLAMDDIRSPGQRQVIKC
jgi:hypothetical protein